MKKLSKLTFLFLILQSVSFVAKSQEVNVLLKEADNLEIKLKEPEALEKYKQVLLIDAKNIKALVKSSELSSAIGARLADKKEKQIYFQTAFSYAQRAMAANENDADANYLMAMASGKMTDIETDNKKVVAYVKDIKTFADKALQINPKHAKANYTLGKWHYEMVNLSGFKKAAVKLFYGGLPDGTLDNAILFMEKCKMYDPYFVLNYWDLAKAYQQDNKPTKTIEVLQKLVKLPLRTLDDAGYKSEGQKLLTQLQ
jgi:uncharacterized protein YutD